MDMIYDNFKNYSGTCIEITETSSSASPSQNLKGNLKRHDQQIIPLKWMEKNKISTVCIDQCCRVLSFPFVLATNYRERFR